MLTSFVLLSLTRLSIAGYVLQDAYTPSNFFSKFDFFTGEDPTQGFVKFLDQPTAQSAGIINSSANSVTFGVEHASNAPNGRESVRIESKASYNQGLIIADIAHMPGSICGTWPAFWTIGPDWPTNGEIDIIEGVNSGTTNQMTLHTGPGCTLSNPSSGAQSANTLFTGQIKTTNCDINAPNQGTNVGCGIGTTDTMTYGDGFNNEGGGVYATEWTGSAISIFHFARSNIPADILSGNPDPTTWGPPLALFQGCNFANNIKNQSIIFDTTMCGQWAGQQSVWAADPVCSKKAATCNAYVQNNPADFANAFWQVNSVKVYQNGAGFIGSAPASSAPATLSTASYSQGIPPAMSTSQPIPTTFSTKVTQTAPISAPALPSGISIPANAGSVGVQYVTVQMTTTMTVDPPAANVVASQQTAIPSIATTIQTSVSAPPSPAPPAATSSVAVASPAAPAASPSPSPLDSSDFPGFGKPGGIPAPSGRHFKKHRRGLGHAHHQF